MAFKCPEMVQETTQTTGTGTYTVQGAVSGYKAFSDFLSSADTVYYAVYDSTAANWEVGYGTYTSPDQIARTSILRSSNGDAPVNWPTGAPAPTKNIVACLPGEAMETLLNPSMADGYVKRAGGSPQNTFTTQAVPIPLADGGTAATTAADARTSLGLVIGTNVQAYDAQLADVAAVAATADQFLGGNGSNLVMRTAAQVRTSLGLGTLYSKNVPTRTRVALSGTQSITTAENTYTAITTLNAVDFPGTTDGSNKYEISGTVMLQTASGTGNGTFTIGVFVNASGDTSGTPIWEGVVRQDNGALEYASIAFSSVEAAPTSGHKLCVAVKRDAASDFNVIGTNGATFARVLEVLD